MGYAAEDDSTVVELVYEYAREKIAKGDGYGQIAVSTPDVYKAAAAVEETKYNVSDRMHHVVYACMGHLFHAKAQCGRYCRM